MNSIPSTSTAERVSPWPWALVGLALLALGGLVQAQAPAPGGSAGPHGLLAAGQDLLDREDPLAAWRAFQQAAPALGNVDPSCSLGLGRAHLMLGRAQPALAYAEAALRAEPRLQEAMALSVRALIRARQFDDAVRRASQYLLRVDAPQGELVAARASALFRVQRIEEAAQAYQLVVLLDSDCAEAHLRLGSGLLPPTEVVVDEGLRDAVAQAHRGELGLAIDGLRQVLRTAPAHPIAHRLLGELLLARRQLQSMASLDHGFQALAALRPVPDVSALPVADFVLGYRQLSGERQRAVDRAVALFGSRLGRLLARGGSHDLLLELERTTDAEARQALRGKRTFDGRVWDDVRGIGGLQAATGIESLDEALQFGFDTLAHEVAHQVHFYTFSPLQTAKLKRLYQNAVREGRCLDYYAASNDAEYFGQGVEAFLSLAKRPGGETTHGHTRFELLRVDPDLHDFIAGLVDFDPLRDTTQRTALLAVCVAVALRCGRAEDAVVAAGLLPDGEERRRLLAEATAALIASRAL